MQILVACEYSGAVRDSFRAAGHDAMSCDFLDSDTPGPHYKGDVFDIIDYGWDMMICFPPCTYICSSGLHWNKKRPERAQQTEEALEFVQKLMNANIKYIALENPIGCISSRIRKPDQIIQPWMFGHDASKSTCLWLKNLPLLVPTDIIKKDRYANQTASGQNNLGPSPDRWKIRSTTYPGIAAGMAKQWSNLP